MMVCDCVLPPPFQSVSDPQRPLPCTTTNSSSSSSSSSDKMLSSPDSVPAHPQYRPSECVCVCVMQTPLDSSKIVSPVLE